MNLMTEDDTSHQVEPARRTFLNVLVDNFKEAGRKNYVHRLIYIGDHTLSAEKGSSIGDIMQSTINMVNNEYNDEHLSGILLHYPKYFCHMLEGSEDSIIKHLILLKENVEYRTHCSRLKMLICYHHINQRFLNEWVAVTGKPPTLLERLDADSMDIGRSYKYVYNCVQKMYKLAACQRNDGFFEMDCLPEFGLIEFLLSSPHTMSLDQYIDLYGVIPVEDAYTELTWPVPSEFIPFHIFDQPYDPVTDLPNTMVHQEATEPIVE
ncbi:hypothetical protein PPYR_10920 [Photinus pyralis]|uniref:BLUF domain-containing protein n=2 Tax=Photinus pyralis TaxID=7054 RepID=A0A5N4AHT8_PHOPY|nr:testis-expressed protein 47-like [Photinus pyralis]KAB0796859.1 hypothetical protein PPYR_10920 [Photinus pyralis]